MLLHKHHLLFDRHPVHDPTDSSPPSALHLHHWTNDAFLDQPLRCGFLAEHTILFHHAVCDATWRRHHPRTKLCAFTVPGASTARRSKYHAKKSCTAINLNTNNMKERQESKPHANLPQIPRFFGKSPTFSCCKPFL